MYIYIYICIYIQSRYSGQGGGRHVDRRVARGLARVVISGRIVVSGQVARGCARTRGLDAVGGVPRQLPGQARLGTVLGERRVLHAHLKSISSLAGTAFLQKWPGFQVIESEPADWTDTK